MCATILRPWIDKEDMREVDDAWRGTIPVLGICGGCGDGLMRSQEKWKSPIKKKLVGSTKPREFVMELPPMETPWVPSANDVRVLAYYFRATPKTQFSSNSGEPAAYINLSHEPRPSWCKIADDSAGNVMK